MPSDSRVSLFEGSSVKIDQNKLENILDKYSHNNRDVVRKSMMEIVGPEGLIKMTPFGNPKEGRDCIPTDVYAAIRR